MDEGAPYKELQAVLAGLEQLRRNESITEICKKQAEAEESHLKAKKFG